LSNAEVVAALFRATPANERAALRAFTGADGERLPPEFVAFASDLYSRGIDHGKSIAMDDMRERLTCAGQTAGASIVDMERVRNVRRN
jgi:hypothetical protein